MVKRPIYGHTNEESAYVIDDYPYSFSLRCQIKFWIEKRDNKGFRLCSRTENPKTLRWNKPKQGTYVDLAMNMFIDEEDHISHSAISSYDDADKVLEFVQSFPEADVSLLHLFVKAKVKFVEKYASGEAYFVINGEKQETSEYEKEKSRKELEVWKQVHDLLENGAGR